jgi:hypothetical protein
MSVTKGRHLRQFAAEARTAHAAGETTFVTGMELTRSGIVRPDRALRGLREVIAAVEKEGWQHVDTRQILTEVEIYFVRA